MKINTIRLVLVICIGIVGVFDNLHAWNWQSFIIGFVCGLPLLTIWLKNRNIALLLLLLSVGGLLADAFGVLGGVSPDRVMFNGILWGCILGAVPAYLLNKPYSIKLVKGTLERDGYVVLAQRFEVKLTEFRAKND